MANAYTSTGSTSLGGSVGSAGLVQKAYDRLLEFALRSQPLIRQVADKRVSPGTLPGSTIGLQIYNDLTAATSTLSETVDPDSVALATPNIVNVTMAEYGNAVVATRALQLFSLADVDPAIANIIAYNMADSIDKIVMAELAAGTNVIYGNNASTATITAAGTVTAADIRKAVAKLRSANAVPRKGSMYWTGVHPEVSHDLRAETGAASWRDPHVYQSNDAIWSGEIGAFEGAFFVESPRLSSGYNGATTNADSFTNTGGSAGTSGTKVITLTTATTSGTIQPGYLITGTNVGSGARVASVSADGLTVTVTVNNSGAVSGTITFQPTVKVYNTIVAGAQALAEAVAEEPHVVIGPVTDKLMRLRPVGWYGVLGFKRFREEALYRIETSSSIA